MILSRGVRRGKEETMPKLTVVGLAAPLLLVLAAPAGAVPTHGHCLTPPSGEDVFVARGVTERAPHETAFHNFHSNVHEGVFLDNLPESFELEPDFTEPFDCPPSD
jgi:hypothetical protein